MKNQNKIILYISIVFIILYISTIIIIHSGNINIIKENNSYKSKIDSLKMEVNNSKYLINIYETKIDSLYKTKNQITNNYETNIQNLSNPNIVSDDSITNYIKSQISK